MNISFCKLGEEECDFCESIKYHDCKAELPVSESSTDTERLEGINAGVCEECDSWVRHFENAKLSRTAYRNDADRYPEPGKLFLSGDMQKVVLLPRLPGMKKCIFTRRIIAFNETFAPLKPSKEVKKTWQKEKKIPTNVKPVGIVWHEGITGRNDEDVTSANTKLFTLPDYREATDIVEWLDNCSAQLKNWTAFGAMVFTVNNHPTIQSITLKYFEKGHTFMSADAFHHQVEQAMKDMKNVYTFQDFVQCVNKNGIAVEMRSHDFHDYRKYLSSGKDTHYPKLNDIVVAQFRRGSTKLFWKTSHTEVDYKSGEFLQKKFRKRVWVGVNDPKKSGARGVQTSKKMTILKNIGPLIPACCLEFWRDLPENEKSADLTANYDHLANPTE